MSDEDDDTRMNKTNHFGTPALFWNGDMTRFFPASEVLSPAMVGLLVRADEVRSCFAHIYTNLDEQEQGTDAANPSLRNRDIENMMFFRMAVMATFDIEKHLRTLNADDRFRDALNALARNVGTGFFDGKKQISGTIDKWRSLRNQLFAHVDYEPIEATLKRGGGIGGAWLGTKMGDFSFPVAHLALMTSIEPADGEEFLTKMKKKLDMIGRTHAAVIQALWPAIYAFDVITGSFLPEKLRPPKKVHRLKT